MALTDRRPMALSTNTPVSSSPTFNPNTLGSITTNRKTKTRNDSLSLHATEKTDTTEDHSDDDEIKDDASESQEKAGEEDDEDADDMDHDLEQDPKPPNHNKDVNNHDQDHENDSSNDFSDDDDDKHSIASDLGKMGLANDSETSSTSRSTSPDSVLDKNNNKSITRESTPPTTTSTPSSSQGSDTSSSNTAATATEKPSTKKVKKTKPISRAPIATGISTAIPVTGEKPKPIQEGDASLEDDVLYAIFVILYERDPQGFGFTVKQICDVLTEEHPQIAQLSTKTSNLVSAKLNAYVKRVEKGDTSLKYAISRDWADASPKRMVYVYRGLLAPGFEVVAKKLTDELKQQRGEDKEREKAESGEVNGENGEGEANGNADAAVATADTVGAGAGAGATARKSSSGPASPKSGKKSTKEIAPYVDDSLEAGKQATLAKPRRQTMFDLGVTKNSFFSDNVSAFEKTNLFVPYASAPVTAALTNDINSMTTAGATRGATSDMMDLDVEVGTNDNRVEVDDVDFADDDDDDFANVFADSDDDVEDVDTDYAMIETMRKNGKRSKSMSYLSMTKKTKVLTAAAAAPRASRAPSSHSPNAAAAAAALHAAALRAISRSSASGHNTSNNNNASKSHTSPCSEHVGAAAAASATSTATPLTGSLCANKKWLSVIRSGFLSQDIGAPEDTSLSDIEKFFA